MKTHRTYCLLTTFLCCVLLLTLGCLPIAAAEDRLRENQAAANEAAARLSDLITHYDEKASDAKLPADRAIEVIGTYSAEIAALIPGNMSAARTEDLRPTFALLYAKGELAAKLSWIAYVHAVIDEQNPSDPLRAQYLALCEDVRATTDEATLRAHTDDMCIRMNRAVFKEKILALPQALAIDETHVLEQLQEALSAIDAIADPDVDGKAYLAVFEATRETIVLAQNRLHAKDEFGKVYDLLGLPSADKLPALSALASMLATATSTEDVNAALFAATQSLLHAALPDHGPYTLAYRNALTVAMQSAVQSASGEAVARFCPYLDGTDTVFAGRPFLERALIVFAKDRIEAIRLPSDDAALFNLLNEYVQTNGILERCARAEDLNFEIMRAQKRAEWARQKTEYLTLLEQTLPTATVGTLLTRAKGVYSEIDVALCEIPTDTENGEDACDTLLAAGRLQLENLVCEAEAERFRITHADILVLTTPDESVRPLLDTAIDAFEMLRPETREKLSIEQETLNDHYKYLTAALLRAYLINDACVSLREDTVARLLTTLNALSSAALSPAELRAEADAYHLRAETIHALLNCYAEIRAAQQYARYDSESVTLLQSTVTHATEQLLDPSKTSTEENSLLPSLERTLADTLLIIDRRFAIAELRVAAGGSSLPAVTALLQDATQRILQAVDRQSIFTLLNVASFRIAAYAKADEMRKELNDLKLHVTELRALTEAEKNTLLSSDDMRALAELCTNAESAADRDTLTTIAATFAEEMQSLRKKLDADSLAAGLREAIREVTQTADVIQTKLSTYQYLSPTERRAYEGRLRLLVEAWEKNLSGDTLTWDRLDQSLVEIRESMTGLAAGAELAEQTICRENTLAAWQAQYAHADHYSAAHYERICALLEEGKKELANADGMSTLLNLLGQYEERLQAIPDRLDEAIERAESMLKEAYEIVSKNKICYGEEAWAEIENIYRSSLDIIKSHSSIADIDNVLNISTKKSEEIKSIRMDHLYTDPSALTENQKLPVAYPSGYHAQASGYWGKLTVAGGISHDSSLDISHLDAANHSEALLTAIKRNAVVDSFGKTLSAKQMSALRDSLITCGFSVQYTQSLSATGTLSLLLPQSIPTESIIGIVFFRDDGSAEFYNCKINQQVISFDVSHFSDFYIVSKKDINLTPLILIMSLILFCEIAAILLLLWRRREKLLDATLPAIMPIIPLAKSITPRGGIPAVIILSVCILAATAALIWLLLDEITHKKALEINESFALKNETKDLPISAEDAPFIPAKPPRHSLPPHEPLPSITAELANEIMSDEEAAEAAEIAEHRDTFDLTTAGGKKATINIDVISKNFEANDTVSPVTLKERGLISKNARAIKILGRGSLDKPLTVIANDFSATAIKMILLTGGKTIFIQKKSDEKYNN